MLPEARATVGRALQGQSTRRTLQEVEQRMHELSYFCGVFFATGYLSEPVAFRGLATNSQDFRRIHSISVRTPNPPRLSGFPMLKYRAYLSMGFPLLWTSPSTE